MKQELLKKYYDIIASLARKYLSKNKDIKIIWVTWSVGKTSCRMIVAETLQKLNKNKTIYTSPKNFNSELWLSLSILKIEKYSPSVIILLKTLFIAFYKAIFSKPDYDVLVLEYGIDHKWDMDYLLKIAEPNISIFTKLDKVHSAYFNSLDEIWDEKFKLLQNTKNTVFINKLEEYICDKSKNLKNNLEVIFYWKEEEHYKNYNIIKNIKNNIEASFEVILDDEIIKVNTNLIWKENIAYIALALNIAKNLWYQVENNIIIDYKLQAWRFSIFEGIKGSVLVDSSYNASPLSMKKMIENTYNLKNQIFKNHKIMLVLWDMRELWEFSENEHKMLASSIISVADKVITVWPEMQDFLIKELRMCNFSGEIFTFLKSNKAGEKVLEILEEDSENKYLVLFKWSQNTIFMEESIKPVLKNYNDESELCRQSVDWMIKKKRFFGE